jgi:branched-chain amino acid transport system ATP-binding protein
VGRLPLEQIEGRVVSDQTATEIADAPSSSPILSVSEVSVSFGGIRALDGVSLSVGSGEIVGLIGPNGAGKTTLFDVISGVRFPQSGKVQLEGVDVTSRTAIQRARSGLRRTYQAVQVFGWLSVVDNVVAALEWEGGGGGLFADLVSSPTRRRREKARRAQAMAALERCGLAAVADAPSASLPIGQARMVELARATADPPKVLLLDEPTSGLEPAEATRLAELIRSISHSVGCAVLLVEHDMDFVMGVCDRIVVLNLGQVIAQGTPEEVRADEAVRTAYLGTS